MSRLAVVAVPLFLLAAPVSAADRNFDADTAAKVVAPFLYEDTIAVIHVDLTRINSEVLTKQIAAKAGVKLSELTGMSKVVVDALEMLTKAKIKDLFVIVTTNDRPSRIPFLVIPLEKGADPKAIMGLRKVFASLGPQYSLEQLGNLVVVGTEERLEVATTIRANPRPEVVKAFTAAGDGVVQVVLLASPAARALIETSLPNLPSGLGGGSMKELTHGARWVSITVPATKEFQLRLIAQSADNASAQSLHDWTAKVTKTLGEQQPLRDAIPNADKVLKNFVPKLDGDRVTLTVDEATFDGLYTAGVDWLREEAARATTRISLMELSFAMLYYHDIQNSLPAAASFDKNGKALLSWRVHLLPFINEGKLYQEFHLDEPWDSEHNKKLIPKMPKVFASPTNQKLTADGKTTYLLPIHKDAVCTGDKLGLRYKDITDDHATTILLVDVDDSDAVFWTKPDDLRLDPKNPGKSLGLRHDKKYMFGFADGRVRVVSATNDKATLWALFTRAGGEKVNLP